MVSSHPYNQEDHQHNPTMESFKITTPSPSPGEPSPKEQAPALCPTCQTLSITQFNDPDFLFQHNSFPTIAASAPTCACCAVLVAAKDTVRYATVPLGHLVTPTPADPVLVSGRREWYISEEGGGREIRPFLAGLDVGIAAEWDATLMGMLRVRGPYVTGQLNVLVEDDSVAPRDCLIFGRPYSESADDLSRAIAWYKWCQAEHPSCALPNQAQWTPTRLLDVGPPSGLQEPSLLETAPDQHVPYLALTYCWGTAKMTKTTTKNIAEYKKEIKFSALSPVFQDAVIATRKLGFRYIWIDALCIIQDSSADWEKEAALMTEVYSNATITLSAAVSSSGDIGLFTPRQPLKIARLPLQNGNNNTSEASCYLTAITPHTFGDDVLKGPLSERGWTLQERLLSPRILHFGRDQQHWECQTTMRSEDFAATSSRFFGNRIYQCLTTHLHQRNPHSGGRTPYFVWCYIVVVEYTRRRLTFEKDVLMAILGVANLFRARLADRYVWGLWEADLPRGLLWNTSRGNGGRESDLGAPSWSWLSVTDCPRGYVLPCMMEEIVVEDWSVAGEPDKFGVTRPGVLSLTGPVQLLEKLQPVSPDHRLIDYENESLACVIDYRDLDMGDRTTFFRWYLSENDVKLGRTRTVDIYCLLIGLMSCENDDDDDEEKCKHEYCQQTRGMALLLLKVKGENEDTYKRIGSAQVRKVDFEGVEKRRIRIV